PLALAMVIAGTSTLERGGSIIAVIIASTALLLTYTRGSWLAGAAATILTLILLRRTRWIVIVLSLAAATLVLVPPHFFERLQSIIMFSRERSAENRLALWPEVMGLIAQRPLTGYGFGGFNVLYTRILPSHPEHAHDFMLDFAL